MSESIEFVCSIDSTNAELKRRIVSGGLDSLHALRTDEQTNGRGRRGRSWLTTDGAVMLSIAMPLDGFSERSMMLVSLAAALAVRKAVASAGLVSMIKWPNDLVCVQDGGYKKLCGILTELVTNKNGRSFAVVGIGVNANCAALPNGLMQPATSILLETGKRIEADVLSKRIFDEFVRETAVLLSNPDEIVCEYKSFCITLGKKVTVSFMSGEAICGTASDLTEDGRLRIISGERATVVSAADVSVRMDNGN